MRNKIFWLRDKIKGGKLRKDFLQIKEVLEPNSFKKRDDILVRSLSLLIYHAKNSCDFYKKLDNHTGIADFPVISKTIIRQNIDTFISDKFNKEDLVSVVTSGSTGTPFQVYHNPGKRIRNSADTIYFAHKAGFNVGDKLFYLKIWSASNHKSILTAKLQNVVQFDVLKFNDKEIERFISMLNSKRRKGILGYASALEQVCKYLERYPEKVNDKIQVQSAISMSESLSDITKACFKKYFNVDLFARYSNLENGIIAQQFKNSGNSYLVNTASYYVEVLKIDSDQPTDAGEMGRIVVTDLYNYGMPMLRYDTGDIGKFAIKENGEIDNTILEHIEGRKMDLLFDTRGDLVSSFIMYKNMWKYTEILQYQIIQSGKREYQFKINVDSDFKRESELVNEFKSYLGIDADFKIEYVSEIPLLSSGKRKKIVNTYYNQ